MMNDRFKFRVWDNDKRKYDENKLDYFICCYEGVVYESHASVFDDLTESKKGHYTLEQCTGLKDKNGRLIYEGDIVKDDEGFIDLVKYDEVCGMFKIEFTKADISDFERDMSWELEVIGNIHENPELVEE